MVRVTVQALEAFGPRLVGVQAREETSTDADEVDRGLGGACRYRWQ